MIDMNIINMVDDFKVICKEMNAIGKFEAYNKYTMKYPKLFEGVFKWLYFTDINNLKDMINNVDFYSNLKTAQDNEKNGYIEKIVNEARKVASLLNFSEDFDLYLGMELGNIGGFSTPDCNGTPFIYIGLDRVIDLKFIKYFIPHEMNHMVRISKLKDINLFDFTERVISEGLGSFSPIALYNMEYSEKNICESLGLPIDQVNRLITNKNALIDKVTGEFGATLTQEKMQTYFAWSEKDNEPHLSGYYVGMEIIRRLAEEGYDFAQLTEMPSKSIVKEYRGQVPGGDWKKDFQ